MDHLSQSDHSSEHTALIPHPTSPRSSLQPFYGAARYGFESENDSASDSSLLAYWQILRRYKKAIVLAAFAGSTLGFLVGIPMKPVYRARTSMEVLSLNEDFMNMRQSSPVSNNDNGFDTSEEETQAKLLQGDALLSRVSAKLNPASLTATHISKSAPTGWRAWLRLPSPVEMTARDRLVARAIDTLKVRAVPRTRILEMTVDSTSPQFAADFANAVVQEFIDQNLEARFRSTQKTSEWLRREIDDARARLKSSEDALQLYARQSGLIFTDQDTNVATEKLQQEQQQLSSARADRIAKQARFELSRNSPPDSLPDVLGDESLQDTNSKLNDLRRRAASYAAVFNPGYSKLQAAEAELVSMQAAFDHDRAQVVKRIQNEYQQAMNNERLLTAAYDEQVREVSGQSEKAIQYNILKREVDSNRQLYDTMLQQTKQASIASAMRASNVRVVDPAGSPTVPISPNFKVNSAVGLLAGLFFCVGFVTVRERADKTLHQPGDIKLWANLPELGTIPQASVAVRSSPRRVATLAHSDAVRNRPVNGHDESNPVELITWKHKPSIVAEAFRSSLTSIFFVGENGSRPRVIVFTSAGPGDGKTTVVSNLAIATAEIRRKVLVIDADLRRPRMHDVFGLPNKRGLTDLLSEEFWEDSLGSLIQHTNIPNLDVLTGGAPTQAAAHLLYSPHLAAMLSKLKLEYDMILIDTPPASQMTDARVVGRLADAVVLVARAGQTMRNSLISVKDRFVEDRIRVLGTVLNGWDPKRSSDGSYGKNYYARAYGKYAQN